MKSQKKKSIKKYFKELQWNPKYCKDDKEEYDYFKILVKFIDKEIKKDEKIWKRNWTEPFTKEEKESCFYKDKCYIDEFSPKNDEVQYVLGRKSLTKCYDNCKNMFPVLNIKDYSVYLNDIFIMYILKKQKKEIKDHFKVHDIFPIRIVIEKTPILSKDIDYIIPDHKLMDDKKNVLDANKKFKMTDPVLNYHIKNKYNLINKYSSDSLKTGNLTAREMCILYTNKMNFYLTYNHKNEYNPFILISSYDIKYIQKHYPDQKFQQIFIS